MYDDCFVIAINLVRKNGNNIKSFQESLLYEFSDVESIVEKRERSFEVNFKDGKYIKFTILNGKKYEKFKNTKIK